jgi:hypothetical protein
MTLKLNQVLAIVKGEKTRSYAAITQLNKTAKKEDLYNGFVKVYRKVDEEGEDFPAQKQVVRLKAQDVLGETETILSELFDIEATKDVANTHAKADIVVDGVTIAIGLPPTYLLFLEKQLSDLLTLANNLPTLADDEDWHTDINGFQVTPVTTTHKTKKEAEVLVKYPATKEHPAQTEIIGVDKVVGYWDTTKQSGAISVPRQKEVVARIIKLSKAVKQAREEANAVECSKQHVAEGIFGYLFKE